MSGLRTLRTTLLTSILGFIVIAMPGNCVAQTTPQDLSDVLRIVTNGGPTTPPSLSPLGQARQDVTNFFYEAGGPTDDRMPFTFTTYGDPGNNKVDGTPALPDHLTGGVNLLEPTGVVSDTVTYTADRLVGSDLYNFSVTFISLDGTPRVTGPDLVETGGLQDVTGALNIPTDLQLQVLVASDAPEPGPIAFFAGLGLSLVAALRRRRR